MKRTVGFLFREQCQTLLIFARLFSSKPNEKMEGLRENFSEYEVRLYFDEWLKSLWLVER
jgi:hypothetical protein